MAFWHCTTPFFYFFKSNSVKKRPAHFLPLHNKCIKTVWCKTKIRIAAWSAEGGRSCMMWRNPRWRMWGRWCFSPRQRHSLASSPPRRPVTAPWHGRRHWHLQSVCHTGPASHPPTLPPLTFHSHTPSPFLHSPCDYSHHLAFLSSSDLPL